jgi:hypothetical protein
VLARTPFVLRFSAVEIGLIFFGWGVCVGVAGCCVAAAGLLAVRRPVPQRHPVPQVAALVGEEF